MGVLDGLTYYGFQSTLPVRGATYQVKSENTCYS